VRVRLRVHGGAMLLPRQLQFVLELETVLPPQLPRFLHLRMMNARRVRRRRSRARGVQDHASLQTVNQGLKPAPCSLAGAHGVLPPYLVPRISVGFPAQPLPPQIPMKGCLPALTRG
jgi:hypothetical protein